MGSRYSPSFFVVLYLLCGIWGKGTPACYAQEQRTTTGLLANLHGVTFLTQQEGWVVGQLGHIFHTTDGGKSWKEQESGTKLLLTGVDFVDSNYGWIVGEEGIILHTSDAGMTWERQKSGVSYPLFDVEFIDRKRGWAVGHWGTILFTEDGGGNWTERSLSLDLAERGLIEPATLLDIVDPDTGERIAGKGEILTKELTAKIQKRGIRGVRIREDIVLNAVFFRDQIHGWIVGERGLVLRTEDGGKTWERTPIPRSSRRREGTGEAEIGEEEMEAAGVVAPLPSLYGIFFPTPLQGWVVGQEGTIAWTQNGGQHWELQESNTWDALYDVGVTGNRGWIVGENGTVLVSTDGGRRWERQELGPEYRLSWLRRIAVVPGDHAFMVGADGLVLISGATEEGKLWIQRSHER